MNNTTTKRYKIAHFPFESPSSTRFCIVDTVTGKIVDDAQGWGYRSEGKARAALEYKLNNRRRTRPQTTEKPSMRKHQLTKKVPQQAGEASQTFDKWCAQNRTTASAIKDLFKFSARSGIVVTTRDIEELLEQDGVKSPCPVSEFFEHWS